MKSISFKWLGISLLICFLVMILLDFYLYKGFLTYVHFINIVFLSGLILFCFGGLFYIIQSGFFDIPINAIINFWRAVSQLGRWIKENEFETDKPLYNPENRKRRHPLALNSALIGLLFCIVGMGLSFFV